MRSVQPGAVSSTHMAVYGDLIEAGNGSVTWQAPVIGWGTSSIRSAVCTGSELDTIVASAAASV